MIFIEDANLSQKRVYLSRKFRDTTGDEISLDFVFGIIHDFLFETLPPLHKANGRPSSIKFIQAI